MVKKIVPLAKDLISIPSTAGDTDKLLDVLAVAQKYLKGHELTTFSSENIPSLLYSNKSQHVKHFRIILSAHLDVVPGEDHQFQPYEKDGKLYGRGAKDMKAAAATMIVLFNELGASLPYDLGLQLTTDEEIGGRNGVKHQIDTGVRADFAILGEGTDFRLIHETKTIMNIKLTAQGKSAHSAYPWLGKNAVWSMYQALDNVIKAYPIPQAETPGTTVSIARIETNNQANNIIPDNCTAYLNVRYVNNESDTILPKLQQLMPAGIRCEVINRSVPHQSNPNSYYFQHLKQCTEDVLQTKVPITKAHGASDARYFSEVACDAVEFGIVGQGHHSSEEWVHLKSIENYYTILKNFLLSIK